MTEETPEPQVDFSTAQSDVAKLRNELQGGTAVETAVTSINGQTFEFVTSLDVPVPLGGFVTIETQDGRSYLGQVTDRSADLRRGARVMIDVPEVEVGAARVSQAEIQLEQRTVVGGGTLLARISDDELGGTHHDDVFDRADMAIAPVELVEQFMESAGRGAAGLDIGWSPFASPEVRTTLRPGGFNRHTFLCGQSGSGKTFSLGVVLERLLLDTSLPMIIIDPNSDFVKLGQMRGKQGFDKTLSGPTSEDGYAELERRYNAATAGLRILRPGDAETPLQIRFSELTPHEQAAVLRLDPLQDREEFSAYWRIAESLGDGRYTLGDVRRAALETLDEDARQIGLRLDNLGVAGWDVWAEGAASALGDHLADDWRGLILDVGGLGSSAEQSVVAMSLLGRLWRKREERQPVLVVIDEAHNVCPAEPDNDLQALATEHVVRIAGEGRKFGIYLLLSTQRPQKLHPNVLSQCDNLILMRMNSLADVAHLSDTFSFVPPRLLEQSTGFTLGRALLAGKISPTPTLTKFEGRLSLEGGGDVASTWAKERQE
ncbi:MAG: ATP-binding protein [Acidimicrobiia bacterium]|nr:ATP-binding protein [Acidimicrobiia bacterium]